MRFIDLIPIGKENKISRHTLISKFSEVMNIPITSAEREFQRWLSEVRKNAVVISSGSGYYRPRKTDVDDIEKYIAKEKHRMICVNQNLKYAEKYLADLKARRIE